MQLRWVTGPLFLLAATLGSQPPAPPPTPQELIDGQHFKRLRALTATLDPKAAETVYLNAAIQQLWGNLDEAEKLAPQAVAMDPKDVRFHYRLAMIEGEKARRAGILKGLVR